MTQLSLPLGATECGWYEGCTAPLCPRAGDSGRGVWFPGEPVCRSRQVPDWVRRQRQIARLPEAEPGRCFTIRMLRSVSRVRPGLQGTAPEQPGAEKAWLGLGDKARARGAIRHGEQLKLVL